MSQPFDMNASIQEAAKATFVLTKQSLGEHMDKMTDEQRFTFIYALGAGYGQEACIRIMDEYFDPTISKEAAALSSFGKRFAELFRGFKVPFLARPQILKKLKELNEDTLSGD